MNDRFQTYIHKNFINIMFVVMCAVIVCVFCFCLRGSAPTNNNVNGTVQQIKQDVDTAGTGIKQATLENESARNAVDRASATVGEMRERTDRVQAGVREANNLIAECQRLNKVAQDELKSVTGANK